jgi:hypothetical protein
VTGEGERGGEGEGEGEGDRTAGPLHGDVADSPGEEYRMLRTRKSG